RLPLLGREQGIPDGLVLRAGELGEDGLPDARGQPVDRLLEAHPRVRLRGDPDLEGLVAVVAVREGLPEAHADLTRLHRSSSSFVAPGSVGSGGSVGFVAAPAAGGSGTGRPPPAGRPTA